jgi:hypothetical protein
MPESAATAACSAIARPAALLDGSTTAHGLRGAVARRVGASVLVDVWLYEAKPPTQLLDKSAWRLVAPAGARKVSVVNATLAGTAPEQYVTLELDVLPDAARYRLEVVPNSALRFDPLRMWLPVRLRPDCPELGSCFAPPEPRPAVAPSPVHDYTARDWSSLRRALVEFLVRDDPDADLSAADPTISLLELFAHVGDVLHYRLDRVATEAYLETARLRSSVRRHARLVDFRVTDGSAARTWVHLSVASSVTTPVAALVGDVATDETASPLAFAVEGPAGARVGDPALVAHAALGEIAVYDWGEPVCRLPAGATECVLIRPKPADALGDDWLQPGDALAFEVVAAYVAGTSAKPDWNRRWWLRKESWPTPSGGFREPLPGRPAQVVRLEAVEPFEDPLAAAVAGSPLKLTRVRWRAEDALRFDFPVTPDAGAGLEEIVVARGNVVAAHHGRLVDGAPGSTVAARLPEGETEKTYAPTEFELVACGAPARNGRPAGPGLSLDERGLPYRLEVDVTTPSGIDEHPVIVPTLLEAPEDELAAVVEIEEHEPPLLRFVTGFVGIAPPLDSSVHAAYEVGGGSAGNVPANVLAVLDRNFAAPRSRPEWKPVPNVTARNVVAATGGTSPMPLDEIRRDAPEAFAAQPRRAVLAADHATLAAQDPAVQRAAARAGWTGSWPLVTTLVDLAGDAASALPRLRAQLDAARLLGTEVAVVEGRPIGVYLALRICATPGVEGPVVRAAALDVLRPGSDERPGVFHRSRLELGTSIFVSAAVAAVAALPFVDAVEVVEARRLDEPHGLVRSVIRFASDEVGVLDDDPLRPERGRLDVTVEEAT